jgi:copper chaperone CopZ
VTTTDLDLRGMSCASCAARVEGALNGLDGVRAAVNFALERAHIQHGPAVSASDLIRAVESTGYQASVCAHHPDESVLGLRLQRGGHSAGGRRPAQPDDLGCDDGVFVTAGRDNSLRLRQFEDNPRQDESQASSPGNC